MEPSFIIVCRDYNKSESIRNPWITLIIVIELMACLGALGALVKLVFGASVAGD
jgi:hypothetical protein